MAERAYRCIALAALGLWIGGTTFYALVVVPTGSRLFGSVEQGLLTEQVTRQLNWIGVVSLVVLLPAARKSKLLAASWLVLAASLAALFWLHPRIAAFIDHTGRTVADHASFYAWHRAYLLTTTVQWFAGVVQLWGLTSDKPRQTPQPPAAGPRPYDMREKNMAC